MDQYGVDPDRIIFFDNRLAKRNYLDCYNEMDISLDAYPVTGGTTTIDSLWMGVPVVSMEDTQSINPFQVQYCVMPAAANL